MRCDSGLEVQFTTNGDVSSLGLQPFRWVGRISYSLYLWHWPILIIAADEAGKTSLPFRQNVVWLLLALGLSLASYRLVENPIRHLRVSAKKSVALGVGAVLLTVAALSVAISAESEPLRSYTVAPVANAQALYRQVAAATSITRVPTDMEPIPTQATNFWGGNFESLGVGQRPLSGTRAYARSEIQLRSDSWLSTATPMPSCGCPRSSVSPAPRGGSSSF